MTDVVFSQRLHLSLLMKGMACPVVGLTSPDGVDLNRNLGSVCCEIRNRLVNSPSTRVSELKWKDPFREARRNRRKIRWR